MATRDKIRKKTLISISHSIDAITFMADFSLPSHTCDIFLEADREIGVSDRGFLRGKNSSYCCQKLALLTLLKINFLLARLFSKNFASRYCHSPGGDGGVRPPAKTLTFSNISVITEDIN